MLNVYEAKAVSHDQSSLVAALQALLLNDWESSILCFRTSNLAKSCKVSEASAN